MSVPAFSPDATRTLRALLAKAVAKTKPRPSTRQRMERAVRDALAAGADPNAWTCLRPRAPLLHVAARSHIPDLVAALLEAGARPNDADSQGETGLQAAVSEAAVRHLLSHGADVDATCLVRDPGIRAGAHDVGGGVMGTVQPQRTTALVAQLVAGRFGIAEILLAHGADPNAPAGSRGNTVLHLLTEWVVDERRWRWNAHDDATRQALFVRLIEAGGDVHRVNDDGQTPLGMARVYADPQWQRLHNRPAWATLATHMEAAALARASGRRPRAAPAAPLSGAAGRSGWRARPPLSVLAAAPAGSGRTDAQQYERHQGPCRQPPPSDGR